MHKSLLFILVLLGGLIECAYAQKWSKVNPLFVGSTIDLNTLGGIQCYDSGIAIAGASTTIPNLSGGYFPTLLKMDANGDPLWNSVLTDSYAYYSSMGITSDNGFILGGIFTGSLRLDTIGAFILKLNTCGQKEWAHYFYSDGNFNSVMQVKDGGYIACMGFDTFNLVVKLNSKGKMLWSVGFSIYKDGIINLLEENDGSFLITGKYSFNAKISAAGKLLWIYNYDFLPPKQQYAGLVESYITCEAKDKGSLTVLNMGYADSSTVAILKLDSNGKKQWIKMTGDLGLFYNLGLTHDYLDNGYILFEPRPYADTGYFYNIHDSAKLVRLDSDANVLQERTFAYQDYSGNISPVYNNQFLISSDEWRVYDTIALHLWKINPTTLEEDSFDTTTHFVYDYLCKNIHSDTITLAGADTDIIDTAAMTIVTDSGVVVRTGIPQNLPATKISVYPNPFTTTLTLTAAGLSPAEGNICIMDLQGREVYRTTCTIKRDFTKQIDLSPLPSGLYILKITSPYDNYTVKVSKM